MDYMDPDARCPKKKAVKLTHWLTCWDRCRRHTPGFDEMQQDADTIGLKLIPILPK